MSSIFGSWELLPYNSPILPVHAALLPPDTKGHSRVLFIAGSGNDPDNAGTPDGSVVWDYKNGTFYRPLTSVDGAEISIDFFCAGHSFLPDGSLLVAGGTEQYDPFNGLQDTLVFDRNTQQWSIVPSMTSGRWYPTLVTLRDGNILACSGLNENGSLDTYPEIYSTSKKSWTVVSPYVPTSNLPMYAHLFLLRDGRLFYSGGYFDVNHGVSPRILTLPKAPSTQAIAEQAVGGLQDIDFGDQAASVLLPPAHEQRVMIIGGGNPESMATKRVNIVQLSTASQYISKPTYKAAPPLHHSRMHHNAVLLPDRTVFVCGGGHWREADPTLPAEIYNPATNTWTEVATSSVPRLYHSVALLLPDGRVVSAGGNPDRSIQELRLEVYSPPYLFKGTRPVINSAPQQLAYGQRFQIQTPQASNIKWVNLIKPMATTHGLDTEQRVVNAGIKSRTSTSLTVTLTSNPNLAPPGWYMLFITNNDGVPSVANWIQIRF